MTVTESLPALEAVRRELEIDEQAPGGHPQVRAVLTLTTTLDLAPARLWPLLTRPAELAAWYGPVEGDLAEGGGCTAPDGVRGRVLEVEEPHRLTLVREQDGAESLFVLRLDPEDDGTTQLSLRHTVLVTRERFDAGGIGEIALGWELALLALAAPASPRRRRRPRGGGTARRGAATCGPGPCAGRPRRSPPGWTRSPHGAPRRRRCAPS
jgi:uncharacterized protein YndB with AHSA1/START domain